MGATDEKPKNAIVDVDRRRNDALKSAIKFSKVDLLVNILYFAWRVSSIFRSAFVVSGGQLTLYIAFLVIEWTYAVTGILNALLLTGLGKKWTPQQYKRLKGADVPRIDILLPCYGEDLEIIKDTVVASINQDYPKDKYRVVILDDGDSKDVKQMIADLQKAQPSSQLFYAARGAEIKIHSKAANINFGLDHVKTLDGGAAPYFGVLDIDMIPTAEWLRATIPYVTEDEKVALAGSPQKFYNLPQGFTLASRYHLETDVMQRLFDASGKALCMGSGYLARRTIIEELGGFPAMIKQEDTFIVSIILQAHGYRTRLLEEEHQHGLYALTYTDIRKAHTKWMSGIIHAYALFSHPIMAGKSFGTKFGGVFPILHITVLRLFMMLSLPAILVLAQHRVIPDYAAIDLTATMALAFAAYSCSYILSWTLSVASNNTVSIDDGQRLWHLPYQLKGLLWLAKHAVFGETHMGKFLTTGADVSATRKLARTGFLARMYRIIAYDDAWMHLVYFAGLSYVLYGTLSASHSWSFLAASVGYPPFTKLLLECLYQALIPVQYCLSPDPNSINRAALLTRDPKTGIARPTKAAITPPKPPFWGTLGYSAFVWAWFAAAPAATLLQTLG